MDDNAMPVFEAYPVCTKCLEPYVLRRTLRTLDHWVWQRDCGCRGNPPAEVVRVKS